MGLFDKLRGSRPPTAHGPEGRIAEAAMCATDPVAAILPANWSEAVVELEKVGDALRVKKFNAKVTAASEGSYCGDVAEIASWTAATSAAFSRLREALQGEGMAWEGGAAELEREQLKQAHVRLRDDRGQVAHEIAIGAGLARGQLLNPDIMRFFDESAGAWAERQASLKQRLKTMLQWNYQAEQRVISFDLQSGESLVIPVQILGSFSEAERSWCWSWANRTYDAQEYAKVVEFRERAFTYVGMGAVWRPGYFCDERFSAGVSHLTTEEMGGTAVFQHKTSDGLTTFFALMG